MAIFTKVDYASTELHNITLRLHEAEIRGDLISNVINAEGVRMKELGIYGL